MTAHDHAAADQLDRYLDRLARADAPSPDGLDPRLAAAARALRAQDEAVAPDPRFVARLRETLLMDATIPVYDSAHPARNGVAPSRATSPFRPLPSADARQRDARPRLAGSSGRPVPPPVAIGSRHARSLARRWNRHGWPIVELIAAAVLIVGLVSVMVGGNGGGGLPALLPGVGQTSQDATPVPDDGAVAMAQGNAGRTGEMPGPGVADSPEVAWSKSVPDGVFTSATVVQGDSLYAFSQTTTPRSSQVAAYDTVTGSVRWQAGVSEGFLEYGAPAVGNGLVFVPVTEYGPSELDYGTPGAIPEVIETTGFLLALDTRTGEEVWRFETGGIGYLSPLLVDDLVYVTDGVGRVQGISVESGEEVWSVEVATAGNLIPNASLSSADGLVYVATSLGVVHALSAMTGEEAWAFDVGGDNPTTPVVSDGVVYVATSYLGDVVNGLNLPLDGGESLALTDSDEATPTGEPANALPEGIGRLHAIDAMTGESTWTVDLDRFVRPAPTVVDDMVILAGVGADGDEVVALDAATGMTELWSLTTDGNVDTSVVTADGVGYVGTYGSMFYAIDLANGSELWSVRTAGSIGLQAFVSGGLVFLSSGGQDGTLYALGEATNATPGADATSSIDVSGRSVCDVEPRPELDATPIPASDGAVPTVALPEEEPVFTLPDIDVGTETQQPVIAWSEIPVGGPATDEQVAGISESLEQMQNCDRPGNGRYVAAFYSEDYFLRPHVIWNLAYNGYEFYFALDGNVDETTIAAQSRILPDGRIAIVRTFAESPDFGQLFVFVEQNGRWLIDEFVEITPDGVFVGG